MYTPTPITCTRAHQQQQRGLAYLPGFAGPVIGEGRSSLCLSTIDKPGALEEVLRMFWKHDVNMTRIESKPKVFEYVVYLPCGVVAMHVSTTLTLAMCRHPRCAPVPPPATFL